MTTCDHLAGEDAAAAVWIEGRLARVALAIGAASLILLGFFLPWVEGANILDFRSFTGFDLARLVRNFEIAAASGDRLTGLRATALGLYLVPALATNAAAFECLSLRLIDARRLARIAALVAGAYALIVLAVVLGLSQAPVNDFEVVVGTPAWGFAVVALGAGLFVWLGAFARTGSDPAGRPV